MKFKLKILLVALVCAFPLTCCSCSHTEKDNGGDNGGGTVQPDEPKESDITEYVTTADGLQLFRKSSFDFAKPGSMSPNQVKFSEDADAKEVDGFGLAITTATCYNLLKMSQADRTAFLKEMFSENDGVGSSLIRVSIGASDFCLNDEYTWCDKKGIENFGVPDEDKNYLFPILKEIYAINPNVQIIGTPVVLPTLDERWILRI